MLESARAKGSHRVIFPRALCRLLFLPDTRMAAAAVASQAQAMLRGRLCDPAFVHSALRSPDTNYR